MRAEWRCEHPAAGDLVEHICREFQQWEGYPQDRQDRFACELLLREALVNAVTHGSPPGGPVRCVLRANHHRILISVRDCGDGFDWRDAWGRAADGHQENGRGLAIYRHYASLVRFSECGNSIALIRRLANSKQKGGTNKMITKDESQGTMCPPGDIVASSTTELRAALKKLIDSGVRQLELDLTHVTMIDSAGLGLLIAAHNSLRKVAGEMTVIGASPEIVELLTTMRMTQHFRVRGA